MKKLSLNAKLLLNFLFIASLGMALAGGLSYRFSYDQVYNLTILDLQHSLKSIESSIQISYNDNIERQKNLSLMLKDQLFSRFNIDTEMLHLTKTENQVTHEVTEENVATFLIDGKPIANNDVVDHINANSGSNSTLMVKTSKGFLRVSTNVKKPDGSRATGTYIPMDSPVSKMLLTGQPYYGRAQVVGTWFITAYEPILNAKNEVVGAFYVGTKETSLAQIKNYIKDQTILKSGYYYILDDDGNMISHPTLEGKNVLETTDADGKFIFKDILKGESGILNYRWKAETGEVNEKISIYNNFPLMKWHIVASFNTDEVKENVIKLRNVIIGITIIALLVMSVFIYYYAGKISKNIDNVTNKITQASELINTQSSLITDVSVKLADSSNKQASALQETVSTLDEITATVQTNLETTRQSRELSLEVQKITDSGFEVMNNLNSSVTKVNQQNNIAREEIQSSYKEIESIIDLINTIDQKTKVINDIVFQTKLLSFNASVEAARAGEQGKGFAVVAEEIGKLASMTGSSAVEIQETLVSTSQKVKDIIASSERRVKVAFEASSKEIDECSEISLQGISALEDIKKNVTKSAQSIDSLTTASEEQSQAIGNIAQAVQEIDQVTLVTAELSKESHTFSQKLDEQSIELNTAMKSLVEIVHGDKA